jgi:hypothetical protein
MAPNDITFAPSYAEIRQILQDSGAAHIRTGTLKRYCQQYDQGLERPIHSQLN